MTQEFKVARVSLFFSYFVIVGLSLMAIFAIFFVVLNRQEAKEVRWFAGLWALSLLAFGLPKTLRMPHTIVLDECGKLIFKSLLSKRAFNAKDLISIRASFWGTSFLYFKFKEDKVAVIYGVDGLSQLIWLVKSINPNVQTKGC